jgi:hypothetical protein
MAVCWVNRNPVYWAFWIAQGLTLLISHGKMMSEVAQLQLRLYYIKKTPSRTLRVYSPALLIGELGYSN